GLSKGNCWKLTEFIESHKETLCNDYARLSHAQKNNYEVEIIRMCADKQHMVRNNPRAVQCDMQATLTKRYFLIFFLVSECWMLIQDKLDEHHRYHGVFIVADVDADFILRENKLTNHTKMDYTNYKHTIVEHYGVELKG
ncbi:hypothetical protein C8R48DRAFT_543710, partial [Suillus tomentosus]